MEPARQRFPGDVPSLGKTPHRLNEDTELPALQGVVHLPADHLLFADLFLHRFVINRALPMMAAFDGSQRHIGVTAHLLHRKRRISHLIDPGVKLDVMGNGESRHGVVQPLQNGLYPHRRFRQGKDEAIGRETPCQSQTAGHMPQIRPHRPQDEISHFHAEEIIEHLKEADVKTKNRIADIPRLPDKLRRPAAEALPPVKARQRITLDLLPHFLYLAKLRRLLNLAPLVLRPGHDVLDAADSHGGMKGADQAV